MRLFAFSECACSIESEFVVTETMAPSFIYSFFKASTLSVSFIFKVCNPER